jgi:hypothetical protein
MFERRRIIWFGCTILCIALLCAPALWNGFPLLQYDTGGYLARWYEGTLELSRGVAYGLLLTAGASLDFWPVVLVQAALTVWVITVTLRTHALGDRPWLLTAVIAVLTVVTTLPWLTGILLTDIFAGLSVLALHLVVFKEAQLCRAERVGLIVLIAYAAATHNATLAVLLALTVAAAIVWLVSRQWMPAAAVLRGASALVLGAAIVLGADLVVAKQLAWTPGGFSLSFGRMLQDGIVDRYLQDHCPSPQLRLCQFRKQLPKDADTFFWASDVFTRLGRFDGLGAEMRTIALQSLADYPVMQGESAALDTLKQLIEVRSGYGIVNSIWHTYQTMERFTPNVLPALRAAYQQRDGIDFTMINRLHLPVALASMLLLIGVIAVGMRRPPCADLGMLATTVALALLANAFVCGALANPHDRYGARMVWLATLVVLMAAARLWQAAPRPSPVT